MIETKNLRAAVAACAKIASKQTTLPILNCLRIESDGKEMTIHASNIQEHLIRRFPCELTIAPCCVSASKMALFVNAAGDQIGIEQTANELILTGNGTLKIKTLSADEFAALPKDEFAATVLDCVELAKAVEQTSWNCADAKDAAGGLESLRVELDGQKMRVIAATRSTIADAQKSLTTCDNKAISALIHSEFADNARENLAMDGATLLIGKTHVKIANDFGDYFCKQSEMEFPLAGINRVLSEELSPVGTIKRDEALPVLELASPIAADVRSDFATIALNFSKDHLALECHSKDQEPYSREIDGKFNTHSIRLSIEKLLNGLKHCPENEVSVRANDAKIALTSGDYKFVLAGITDKKP